MSEDVPRYISEVREKHGELKRIDIERSILRSWNGEWSVGSKQSPSGYTFSHHFLEYLKVLIPRVDHHEFFVTMARSFEECYFVKRRQICNLIGSQNSGKSEYLADFANAILSIWPEYTTVKVAAPFKKAAESTIWGQMLVRFDEIKKANPDMWGLAYHSRAADKIVYYDGAKTGAAELVTVDKVGKLQGSKSLEKDKGFWILLCDEIALFPSRQILEIIDNLRGNTNFFCYTGCNFKNTEGLEGDMCRPEKREYSDLDIDQDQEWKSAYESYTYRFDGHLCPNIKAQKVIYPYLLKEVDRARMEKIHGLNGPKYREQIRSFPSTSVSEFYVLTRAKVEQSGAYDEFFELTGQRTRVAYCDLGFGGDPCKIGAFEFGDGKIQTIDGGFDTQKLFMPLAPFETIPVDDCMVASLEFLRRLRAVCGDPDFVLREGQSVSKEIQIAVASGEFLSKWSVPRNGFGFDPSMRSDAPQAMFAVLGTQIQALGFEGVSTERVVRYEYKDTLKGREKVPITAKNEYSNYVTELYFSFATMVQSGQLRKADMIRSAIVQICRRWWEWSGSKKKIQSKYGKSKDDSQRKSYKSEHGRSPDDADTVVGGFEMARRNGFTTEQDHRPTGRGAQSGLSLEQLRASKRFRPRGVRGLSSLLRE